MPSKERYKQQPIYRDHINNPIEIGDVIMFTSIKQCKGLFIGRIMSFTPKRIRVWDLTENRQKTVATKHCVVITQQINHNLSEPADGFFDAVAMGTTLGLRAKSYLSRRGFDLETEVKKIQCKMKSLDSSQL